MSVLLTRSFGRHLTAKDFGVAQAERILERPFPLSIHASNVSDMEFLLMAVRSV
jgi:hypothetical protein